MADDYRFVTVQPDEPSWFSFDDRLGEIVPDKGDGPAQSHVVYGGARIALTHKVERVVSDVKHSVFVGKKELTLVEFKPKMHVVFTRSYPLESLDDESLKIQVIDGKIVGISNESSLVWIWSMDGRLKWSLKDPSHRHWYAVALPGTTGFIDESNLNTYDESGFCQLMQLDGRLWSPGFVYSQRGNIIFLSSHSGVGVYQVSRHNGELKIEAKQWYKKILGAGETAGPIKIGKTILYPTLPFYGQPEIVEMDLLHERYRKIDLPPDTVDIESLFTCGRDIYSSRSADRGPVVKGDDIDKLEWIPMEKIPREKW